MRLPSSSSSAGFLRSRTTSRVAVLVATGAVTALLAGCGGGGEEDLSRTEYIADADAICAQFAVESATLEQQFNQALKSSDLEEAAQNFEDQATEFTAMLDQLEGLTPPEADQATVDQIITLGRQRVTTAQEAADAIAGGDKEAMIAAAKKATVLAGEYFQLADGFGFDACGSGGATSPGGSAAGGATGTTGTTG